jgi:hypothetical protein
VGFGLARFLRLLFRWDMRPTLALLSACLATGLSAAPAPDLVLTGPAELFRRDHISTARTEIRLTFSPDGTRMLWGVVGRTDGPGGLEILESVRTATGWSEPALVDFNTPANEFDPSFAPDGSGVYFFSNRPGGLGGDDLYFVPFDAATRRYGPARNLGPAVNSAGDEWAPCVSPDGQRLLFASDGRGGAGKHDLFISRRGADGAWRPAEPIAELNTPAEDFDATFLHDGRSMVFSSGSLEGRVALYWAPWTGERYGRSALLGEEVNSPGPDAFANGPSIAATEPGWLYFSTHREGGAGRMDIYRIRYRLTPVAGNPVR